MANWKHNAMKETGFWLLIIVFKYHCSARPYGHESALSHGSMQKQGSILLSSTFGHMPKSMVGNHNYVVSLRGLYTKRFVVCDRCYDLPILTKVEQMKYTIIGHPKIGAAYVILSLKIRSSFVSTSKIAPHHYLSHYEQKIWWIFFTNSGPVNSQKFWLHRIVLGLENPWTVNLLESVSVLFGWPLTVKG